MFMAVLVFVFVFLFVFDFVFVFVFPSQHNVHGCLLCKRPFVLLPFPSLSLTSVPPFAPPDCPVCLLYLYLYLICVFVFLFPQPFHHPTTLFSILVPCPMCTPQYLSISQKWTLLVSTRLYSNRAYKKAKCATPREGYKLRYLGN